MSVTLNLYRSEAQEGGGDHTTRSIGPFEYVELTYTHIKCGEDGPEFMLDNETGFWHEVEAVGDTTPGSWHVIQPDTTTIGYTDFTIASKESA